MRTGEFPAHTELSCLTLVTVLAVVAWGTLLVTLPSDRVTGHPWRAATLLLAAIPVKPRVTACEQPSLERKKL